MPKGTKVLLVDDDKMLVELYKERLELAGYQVEISRDGEEGLAKIHQVKPDLVLLDIMMPKVNGYEALASIKSDPATKNTPVIILSALMRDINKSKAIESGADDYIIKSEAMPADVIKKIEAVLKKYNKSVPTTPSTTPEEPEKPTVVEPPPTPTTPGPPPAPIEPPPVVTPPEPPKTESRPQEIQFEPFDSLDSTRDKSAQGKPAIGGPDLSVPAAPQAVPPTPITNQPATNTPAVETKPSAVVVFFLILIVILILGSDLFFYLRYMAVR